MKWKDLLRQDLDRAVAISRNLEIRKDFGGDEEAYWQAHAKKREGVIGWEKWEAGNFKN